MRVDSIEERVQYLKYGPFLKKTVSACPSIHVVQFQDSIMRYSQTDIASYDPRPTHSTVDICQWLYACVGGPGGQL